MAATANRMDAQFGYAETGAKVHMGLMFDGSRCIQGPAIVDVIAAVGEDAGRDETFAALTVATVRPSKLCGHCFPIAIRRAYAQYVAAAKAGLRTEETQCRPTRSSSLPDRTDQLPRFAHGAMAAGVTSTS